MSGPRPLQLRRGLAPLLSLFLVTGVYADRQLFHLPAGDAQAYHATVRAAAAALPGRIGDWVATVVPTPASALTLLRPNVLEGREFRNGVTGEKATVAFVQCGDARDMRGHWPPVCYPAQGWMPRDRQERTLAVGGLDLPVTVYRFTRESIDRYAEVIVYSFLVRPDGVIESGAQSLGEVADDARLKSFGAAQMQVSFDPSMPEQRRDEVFALLVASARPVIDAVRAGARR